MAEVDIGLDAELVVEVMVHGRDHTRREPEGLPQPPQG